MSIYSNIKTNNEKNEGNQSMSGVNFNENNGIQARNLEQSPQKDQIPFDSNEDQIGNGQPYNCTPRKQNYLNKNEMNTFAPTNTKYLSTGPGPYPYEQNLFTPFSEEKNSISNNHFRAFQSPFDDSCCMIPLNQENNQSFLKSPSPGKLQDSVFHQQSPELFSPKKVENSRVLNFKESFEKQQIEIEEKHKSNISHAPHNKRKSKPDQFQIPHSLPKSKNINQDHSNEEQKCMTCNCRESRCIKLYCECFKNGLYCNDCNCTNCGNKESNQVEREQVIKLIIKRNPKAFDSVITNKESETGDQKVQQGCNCDKSGCLKKYCVCYQKNKECSELCKCKNCLNKISAEGEAGSNIDLIAKKHNLSLFPEDCNINENDEEQFKNLLLVNTPSVNDIPSNFNVSVNMMKPKFGRKKPKME